MSDRLELVPVTQRAAKAFIRRHHRHHQPSRGWIFGVGVALCGELVGVAMVGRPVARSMDNGRTLEVNRTCTDGTRNANSILYGAAARAARALGWRRLITYTLKSESGASLRASGWRVLWEVKGRSWDCPSMPRVDKHPTEDKLLWEAAL